MDDQKGMIVPKGGSFMSEKKAGIVTFHYAHHYGAQLQAYALMQAVEKLGTPCEIIHYVRPDTLEGNRLFKRGLSPHAQLSNAHTLLHYKAFKRRYIRFQEFAHKRLHLSERFYSSSQELFDAPPDYTAYLCGSDQIWNPLIYKEKTYDPAFFLGFARKGRKIAYAPSFGIASIPEPLKEPLISYLKNMDDLSVRESQGGAIIEELTGREALTVLDPTLLLTGGEWGSIAVSPKRTKPYMLCYFVSDSTPFEPYINALSRKLGLEVVYLAGSRKGIPGYAKIVYDAGPCEFLGEFKDAAFVCTNSFHGTVFSVNNQKDFISFTAGSEKKTVNSRLYSILDLLDIKERLLVVEKEQTPSKEALPELGRIDYAKVAGFLEREREKSLNYLKEALAKQDG